MAKRTGLEGIFVIHAVTDAAGNLTDPKVVSGPRLLQAAAVDSVRKWKYRPAHLNDEPVPRRYLSPSTFAYIDSKVDSSAPVVKTIAFKR